MARAEASYRKHRNRLADCVIARSLTQRYSVALASPVHLRIQARLAQSGTNEALSQGRFRVERLAYRFWEEGGRHIGNSEADLVSRGRDGPPLKRIRHRTVWPYELAACLHTWCCDKKR